MFAVKNQLEERMKQEIIFCDDLKQELNAVIRSRRDDKLFLLADDHTLERCLPLLDGMERWNELSIIRIPPGEIHKNLETVSRVWQNLSQKGATRHSLLINLGGGMVTDLGGFAASVFKRGIDFIHLPTSLLAMVDAAVGGKTGIDFNGLKNEIGTFSEAKSVLIETEFLRTLDRENFLSGYAEMLKHGLVSDTRIWGEVLNFDLNEIDDGLLKRMVKNSVKIKKEIVDQDPYEQNIRKALNFGHTAGHAFESFALASGRPVLHGYAVAWGVVCELYHSHLKTGFPKDKLRQTIRFIKENYGSFAFDCSHYPDIYERMRHDKKNKAEEIRFTLLEDIGKIKIDQTVQKDEIYDMLDFYRECMGI